MSTNSETETETVEQPEPVELRGPLKPVEQPDEPDEQPQEPQEATEADEDTSGPNKEAAKYRRRLREAESERDQLRDRLVAMQKAEAERIAGAVVQNASGLWAAGTDVADLLAEDGTVDEQKVRTATQKAAQQLGLAPSRRHGNYAPLQGRSPSRGAVKPGFEAAFAPPTN